MRALPCPLGIVPVPVVSAQPRAVSYNRRSETTVAPVATTASEDEVEGREIFDYEETRHLAAKFCP